MIAYSHRSPVCRAAAASAIFMAGEALIGAGLVLFELVAHDASLKRALSMVLHLGNTFFLLAALTLTAWWASGGAPIRLRRQGVATWLVIVLAARAAAGRIERRDRSAGRHALPGVRTHAEAMAQNLSSASHLFIRLRMLHPEISRSRSITARISSARG